MHILITVEIDVPADVAFAYIADLTNNPEWQSGVTDTVWTAQLPVVVGTTCEQSHMDGSVVGYRIVALEPGKSISIQTLPGATVAATINRTVHKLNDSRSRVRMELEGRVQGWRVLLTPLSKRLITRAIEADYRRLKKRLESDKESPGQ